MVAGEGDNATAGGGSAGGSDNNNNNNTGGQRSGNRGRGGGRGRGSRGGDGQRGGGGQRRGRGGQRGGDGGRPANPAAQDIKDAAEAAGATVTSTVAKMTQAAPDGEVSDADVCFICANPVAHHSIAPCNHTTCHICGLRMRALYKTKDCAHCRTPAPYVIFTDDAEKRFEDYKDNEFTTSDTNIGIRYTNEDIVGDTVLLLRYNCPDSSCDFAGLGWPDLHRHVKSAHKKRMCDLCTRNKRVFTHEHELFTEKELDKHMKRGDDKPGAADQTGFKGHPLCAFCGERFYDDDKLYEHCRMKHERCFLCDRRDSRQPHYYQDYNALERHFKKDHHLCADSECMEKKFVVFESEMDLQAHQLSEHGGKSIGRDARTVDMSGFDLRQSYQQERRHGGGGDGAGRGGRTGRGRGRGRDPNEETVPAPYNQPLRRDEIAFQRQMAIHSAQSVSTRTFGGSLTAPAQNPTPAAAAAAAASSQPTSRNASGTNTPRHPPGSTPATAPSNASAVAASIENLTIADTTNMAPEERARLVRHNSVIERASNLLANDRNKVAKFREHISSYRQGSFTATQLVDAFFTLFADVSSNALGTLTREVADLFENKAKGDALRKAWQDWRAINEDYPSLPGLSGMQGSSSGSGGWAGAAASNPLSGIPGAKTSNRVLKLKNSTRLGGPAVASPTISTTWSSSPAVRPPPASSFPSLSAAAATPANKTSTKITTAASKPSWTAASSTATAARAIESTRSKSAFPALPAAPKPQTTIFGYGSGRAVRRDYGHAQSNFQWGSSNNNTDTEGDGNADEEGEGKGKKGKKGKKVLVQWG